MADGPQIRIEPDWNVKNDYLVLIFSFRLIRIEPDWNVKALCHFDTVFFYTLE